MILGTAGAPCGLGAPPAVDKAERAACVRFSPVSVERHVDNFGRIGVITYNALKIFHCLNFMQLCIFPARAVDE